MGYGDIVVSTADGEYRGFGHSLVSLPGENLVPEDVQAGIANALIDGDTTIVKDVTVGGVGVEYSNPVVQSFAKALLEKTACSV